MILTPLEFIQTSPVTKDFPPTEVCALIDTEELLWYDECELGIGLYDALKDDLTAIPDTTAEWSRHKAYALGDTVTYYGALLRSKTASNNTEPCLDVDKIHWEILPKFQTPCVQSAWKHIALAFSYRLLSLNLVQLTYKISAKGTTKYSDEFRQNTSGLVTVERGERHDLQQSIDMSAERYYIAMIKYLKRAAVDCTVLQAASFYESTCNNCKPQNSGRRIAFRK